MKKATLIIYGKEPELTDNEVQRKCDFFIDENGKSSMRGYQRKYRVSFFNHWSQWYYRWKKSYKNSNDYILLDADEYINNGGHPEGSTKSK